MSVVANSLFNQSTGQSFFGDIVENPMTDNLDAGGNSIFNVDTPADAIDSVVANVGYVNEQVKDIPKQEPSTILSPFRRDPFASYPTIAFTRTSTTHPQASVALPPCIVRKVNNNKLDDVIEPQMIFCNGYIELDQEIQRRQDSGVPKDTPVANMRIKLVMILKDFKRQNTIYDVFTDNCDAYFSNVTTYWNGKHLLPFSCNFLWDKVLPARQEPPPGYAGYNFVPGLEFFFSLGQSSSYISAQIKGGKVSVTYMNATPKEIPPQLTIPTPSYTTLPDQSISEFRILDINHGVNQNFITELQGIEDEINANGYYSYNRTQSAQVDTLMRFFVQPVHMNGIDAKANTVQVSRLLQGGQTQIILMMKRDETNPHLFRNVGATSSMPYVYPDTQITFNTRG